jgi:hydroxyacylglutathione hydrolase
MQIKTLMVGPIQTSCYIAHFPDSASALVIDPGGDANQIIGYLKQNKLEPRYLINTHGHIDHIGANIELKDAYPEIQVCIHSADASMLTNASHNLSSELGLDFTAPPADRLIKEGDVISLDKHDFMVYHIPGHTPGGICLFYKSDKKSEPSVLFSGDTLFSGGIGRTDFPGGSHQQLINGIKQKIFTLPGDTVVYPGHGPSTTVGEEKESNPFF